jgi:hypothetical protein
MAAGESQMNFTVTQWAGGVKQRGGWSELDENGLEGASAGGFTPELDDLELTVTEA